MVDKKKDSAKKMPNENTIAFISAVVFQMIFFVLFFILFSKSKTELPMFLGVIFNEESVGEGNSIWETFLPFLLSSVLNLVILYTVLILKKRKGGKRLEQNAKITVPLFLFITIALTLFNTWIYCFIAKLIEEVFSNFISGFISCFLITIEQVTVLIPMKGIVEFKEK
ncbi:MAG: hypothetical protein K5917_01850 [Clostridiales bacterium]|nr:hypothetical protein [Clostridiales bacterium]